MSRYSNRVKSSHAINPFTEHECAGLCGTQIMVAWGTKSKYKFFCENCRISLQPSELDRLFRDKQGRINGSFFEKATRKDEEAYIFQSPFRPAGFNAGRKIEAVPYRRPSEQQ